MANPSHFVSDGQSVCGKLPLGTMTMYC